MTSTRFKVNFRQLRAGSGCKVVDVNKSLFPLYKTRCFEPVFAMETGLMMLFCRHLTLLRSAISSLFYRFIYSFAHLQ